MSETTKLNKYRCGCGRLLLVEGCVIGTEYLAAPDSAGSPRSLCEQVEDELPLMAIEETRPGEAPPKIILTDEVIPGRVARFGEPDDGARAIRAGEAPPRKKPLSEDVQRQVNEAVDRAQGWGEAGEAPAPRLYICCDPGHGPDVTRYWCLDCWATNKPCQHWPKAPAPSLHEAPKQALELEAIENDEDREVRRRNEYESLKLENETLRTELRTAYSAGQESLHEAAAPQAQLCPRCHGERGVPLGDANTVITHRDCPTCRGWGYIWPQQILEQEREAGRQEGWEAGREAATERLGVAAAAWKKEVKHLCDNPILAGLARGKADLLEKEAAAIRALKYPRSSVRQGKEKA